MMKYLLLMLCLTGCLKVSFERERDPDMDIHGITKIFHHDGRAFSALVKQRDGSEKIRFFHNCSNRTSFIRDVPDGKDSWVSVRDHGDCAWGPTDLVFHIHKVEDIQGGSYRHGKSSTIKVNVIE